MGRRGRNEGWKDVRRWSVPRKRLALKGRRGKQTWVEHAAHIIALAWVDIHAEQQGSSLLLQVPASRWRIYGGRSDNITSPSGSAGCERYAGRAPLNGLKDQAHFMDSPR